MFENQDRKASAFINRNHMKSLRADGKSPLYSPVHHYKVKTHDDMWMERKQMSNTMGDTFFKRSERHRGNPDYSPKHVGMPWAVSDACDYVRPSAV